MLVPYHENFLLTNKIYSFCAPAVILDSTDKFYYLVCLLLVLFTFVLDIFRTSFDPTICLGSRAF